MLRALHTMPREKRGHVLVAYEFRRAMPVRPKAQLRLPGSQFILIGRG